MEDDDQLIDRTPKPLPDPPACDPALADPVETAFIDQLAVQDPTNPGKPFPTDPQ